MSSPTEPEGVLPAEPDPAEGDPPAEGDASAEGDAPARPRTRRKPLIIALACVAGVLIAALVVLLVYPRDTRDPFTVVTITETEPVPTPEVDPIERDKSTALLEALPDVVLGYAVSDQVAAEQLVNERSALEAWTLTYTSAEGDVQVTVAQWPTAKEAYEAWTVLSTIDDGPGPVAEGEVVVDGETVGGMKLLELTAETERTVWRNGTAYFRIDGPTGTTQAFYDAFGL